MEWKICLWSSTRRWDNKLERKKNIYLKIEEKLSKCDEKRTSWVKQPDDMVEQCVRSKPWIVMSSSAPSFSFSSSSFVVFPSPASDGDDDEDVGMMMMIMEIMIIDDDNSCLLSSSSRLLPSPPSLLLSSSSPVLILLLNKIEIHTDPLGIDPHPQNVPKWESQSVTCFSYPPPSSPPPGAHHPAAFSHLVKMVRMVRIRRRMVMSLIRPV